MTDKEPVEERWTYCGRRYSWHNEKMSYVWRDQGGEQRVFSKASAAEHAVGGIYSVKVTYKDDGLSLHGGRTWTGEMADDHVALKAQDEEAYRTQDQRRREKRAGTLTELDGMVRELLEVVRTYNDIGPIIGSLDHRVRSEFLKRERAKR